MTVPDPSDPTKWLITEPPSQPMLEAMSVDELRFGMNACLEHMPIDRNAALAYLRELDRRGYRPFRLIGGDDDS